MRGKSNPNRRSEQPVLDAMNDLLARYFICFFSLLNKKDLIYTQYKLFFFFF